MRRIENIEEFQKWFYALLNDSKQKLGMSDRTIAYILVTEGMKYFMKVVVKGNE